MGVNRVDFGDETLIDLTEDTVSEDNLLLGETAHDASGKKITGKINVDEKIFKQAKDALYEEYYEDENHIVQLSVETYDAIMSGEIEDDTEVLCIVQGRQSSGFYSKGVLTVTAYYYLQPSIVEVIVAEMIKTVIAIKDAIEEIGNREIPTKLSQLEADDEHQTVTQREKFKWNVPDKYDVNVIQGNPIGVMGTISVMPTPYGDRTEYSFQPYLQDASVSEKYLTEEVVEKLQGNNKLDKNNPTYTGALSNGRAEGSIVGADSVVIGGYVEASASGDHSFAFGRAISSGLFAIAMGAKAGGVDVITEASGIASIALGTSNSASGDYSFAEGYVTQAIAARAHSEGNQTIASGGTSHAEGQKTESSGAVSHAEGNASKATGSRSHAQNENTRANGYAQTAMGKFNVLDPYPSTAVTDNSGYALIVGNGTSESARSNAMTLDWNGNLEVAGDVKNKDGYNLGNIGEYEQKGFLSKNLFDFAEFAKKYPRYCIYTNGELSVTTFTELYTTGLDVDIPSGSYFSFYGKLGTATNVRLRFVHADGSVGDAQVTFVTTTNYEYKVFKTTKAIKGIRFNWTSVGTFFIKDFMVNTGDEATHYTPYAPSNIELNNTSQELEESIHNIYSSNLMDFETHKGTMNGAGTSWINVNDSWLYIVVPVKGGESFNIENGSTNCFKAMLKSYDPSVAPNLSSESGYTERIDRSISGKIPSDARFVWLCIKVDGSDAFPSKCVIDGHDYMESSQTIISQTKSLISDAWNSTTTYAVGDYCIFSNSLWKCLVQNSNTAPSESANWTKVSITDVFKQSLMANNNQFYFDYQNGEYGYNTSPTRGADTFHPFKSGGNTYTFYGTNSIFTYSNGYWKTVGGALTAYNGWSALSIAIPSWATSVKIDHWQDDGYNTCNWFATSLYSGGGTNAITLHSGSNIIPLPLESKFLRLSSNNDCMASISIIFE